VKRGSSHVYQFKITLEDVKPDIWRRIQVPGTYSFWDLHVAIQDSMGWLDYHLHAFRVLNPSTGVREEIGIPHNGHFGNEKRTSPGWERDIVDYFSMDNPQAKYIYDFGDNWLHSILLEEILVRADGVNYPICITGERACPPEDCGGVLGYKDFLEVIMNPDHEEYEQMLQWAGEGFEPEHFNPREVKYSDPDERLRIAFTAQRQ
jgi:hypothetical protein